MRNLETKMRGDASSAIYDMREWDADSFRDALTEAADQLADNVVTYYSDALDIVSRYESDSRANDYDADDMGATFKPSQWQEAMTAYAYGIARSVLYAVCNELVEEAEEAADELEELAAKEGADSPALLVAASCPYGWAAHNYETDSGAMVWRNIEGSRAIAKAAGGIWLHAIWTPETQDANPNT
jgi:hypothetical protein